jgi:hypothetical protein
MKQTPTDSLFNDTYCITSDKLVEALKPYKLVKAVDFETCQNYFKAHLTITDGLIIGCIGILLGMLLLSFMKWVRNRTKKEEKNN